MNWRELHESYVSRYNGRIVEQENETVYIIPTGVEFATPAMETGASILTHMKGIREQLEGDPNFWKIRANTSMSEVYWLVRKTS